MTAGRTLYLLGGGGAQGLVRALKPEFESTHGCSIAAEFGAVGAMRDLLVNGRPCDVIVLSDALILELADQSYVLAHTARRVGLVYAGVAVPDNAPPAALHSGIGLRVLVERAKGIYLPDPAKAIVGAHFMRVARELGLTGRLEDRLHIFPDGSTAMAELARSGDPTAVGCAQASEILYTPGARLADLLPPPYELGTLHTAAVCSRAEEPLLAQSFIELMTGDSAALLREAGGFE